MDHKLISAALFSLFAAQAAEAQPNWEIRLYNDADMSSCTVSYSAPGVIQIHVFHTGDEGSTASSFALYPPACMNGATWLGDVINPAFFGMANTQSDVGVSVAYRTCTAMPIHVGYVNFYVGDTSVSCCEFPVSDPTSTGMGIDGVYCDFSGQTAATGRSAVINPTPDCPCEIALAVETTTWGGVKALYR